MSVVWASHPRVNGCKQVGDVAETCGVVSMATASTFNRQPLCAEQGVVERIHSASWLQVECVVRIQGYQAPVWERKKKRRKVIMVSI